MSKILTAALDPHDLIHTLFRVTLFSNMTHTRIYQTSSSLFLLLLLPLAVLTLQSASFADSHNLTAVSSSDNLWFVQPFEQQLSKLPATSADAPTPTTAKDQPTAAEPSQNEKSAPASTSKDEKTSEADKEIPLISIYHRNIKDPNSQITYATSLTGRLAPHGLAASSNSLWIAYQQPTGLSFQLITPIASAAQDFFSYDATSQTPIPNTTDLLAFAANQSHAFALVRFELKPESNPSTTPQTPSADTDKQPLVDTPPSPTFELRLLSLSQNTWSRIPLPKDFPKDNPVWLVSQSSDSTYPFIATLLNPTTIRVYTTTDAKNWTASNIAINASPNLTFFAQQNQVILAQQDESNKEKLTVDFTLIRSGQSYPIGKLEFDLKPTTLWNALPYNNNLALIAATPEHKPAKPTESESFWAALPTTHNISLQLAQLTLQGSSVGKPQTLTAYEPQLFEQITQNLINILLFLLVIVMIIIFLYRDPTTNKLNLPANLTLSDFPRRLLAASIDFAVVLFPIIWFFHISFQQLLERWPGATPMLSFGKMLPSLLLILIFITHTTLTEILTKGRTLGKYFMKIRVTTVEGKPPSTTQSLSRGILKILELLVWIALIFPVISINRQRLGDMFACTVIVLNEDQNKSKSDKDKKPDPLKEDQKPDR